MKNRILTLAFLVSLHAQATISDNRFIPGYQQTRIRDYDRAALTTNLFFITADNAYGNEVTKKRGIPELYGTFDQLQLGLAAEIAGKTNTLNPIWQQKDKIKWNVHGKIQGQGVAFNYLHDINDFISFGANVNFLHVTSNQKFILPKDTVSDLKLSPAQELELDEQRRDLLANIGITDNHWSDSGFSDIFLFVRIGNSSTYKYKCRYASVGTTFGAVISTSKQRPLKYASSIPLGGENFSGFIWSADIQAELKEDLWAGATIELLDRFSKTQTRRLPIKGEPEIFAPVTGLVEVDPGITLAVSPFVRFNNIRDGWHFQGQYVYQLHKHDTWSDKREDRTIPVNFTNVVTMSRWESEYVLFKLIYDGYNSTTTFPALTFSWDIPVKIFKPEESVKAQKVSLGFEYSF